MEAIRRRFVITNRLPAAAGDMKVFSKISGEELARDCAEGGTGLPTIQCWIDSINCSVVARLFQPAVWGKQWSSYIFWYARRVIGVRGMVSHEGSTPKCVTPLLAFLARYRERRNVLTGSKNIPGLWRARFQSF
eukprot:SAG31_NODE_4421_length_3249_cov_2.958730_6_plen_133_part_01